VGEGQKGRRRGDLEKGNGLAAVGGFAGAQGFIQRMFADQAAIDADTFVKAHQMGRDINMCLEPGSFEHGAQIGDHRSLAVSARDMDHRGQCAFGVTEGSQQPFDAAK
jgi:hypothetical protein